MQQTRERTYTDSPRTFAEQVACALAQSKTHSLHVYGATAEPHRLSTGMLLKCSLYFNQFFKDMDGQPRQGYEYRAQYTDEDNQPMTAEKFLQNNRKEISNLLSDLNSAVYGLSRDLRAQPLGRGISVFY